MNEQAMNMRTHARALPRRRPADQSPPPPFPAKSKAGFTLVEMLVAVAILMAVMSGIILLFTGSMRAVQSGYQSIDAFEQARGLISTLERDLTAGFSARDFADYYNFYGTPIGMTFVAVVTSNVNRETADYNIARVTYVLYNQMRSGDELIPGVLPPSAGDPGRPLNAFPYLMLRYVEPGVGDLDSFPLMWDRPVVPELEGGTLDDYLQRALNDALVSGEAGQDTQEDFLRTKRREVWIRTLAGGDAEIPVNFWIDILPLQDPEFFNRCVEQRNPPVTNYAALSRQEKMRVLLTDPVYGIGQSPNDPWYVPLGYAVASNIVSSCPPDQRYDDWLADWRQDVSLFDYDRAYPVDHVNNLPVKSANPWWNDRRSLNCTPSLDWRQGETARSPLKFCDDPALPEVVTVKFRMIFESPYAGAPDFNREFIQQIFIPSAYVREKL